MAKKKTGKRAHARCLSAKLKGKRGCKKGVKGGRKKCQSRRLRSAMRKCKHTNKKKR